MKNPLRGVYLITDTHTQQRYTHRELAERALSAGVHMIQYREKAAPARHMLEQIREIAALTGPSPALFIVNDRPDLALLGGADGVHLGQEDLPIPVTRRLVGARHLIGGTASTVEEAVAVAEQGADYVAVGHIFPTTTKRKDYPPRGLELLRAVRERVSIPLVAIGGITLENAPHVIEAGADVLAVSGAICRAEDPERAARAFVKLFA
ncbi:thiamine phosphate synthase [Rhodocaloribacter litoris]|uniref:thiamine phosphate synthase n=1 Tax=Rhodocaloribacter litoris TaxID=2558931 RepID=UPI00141F6666|nr:thiamine phosphate synthase [Rhodocaloribacter litoris]QXD16285.1 thiamine phosphate synthase [Rhodocaloribacter litoris]